MKKRFISLFTAVSVAGAMLTALPAAAAEPAEGSELLFSHDFTDAAELNNYTPYLADSTKTFSADSGYISAEFNEGWSADNGIKTDITSYVQGHSGETFSASVDFLTWDYYSNDAVLGFDVVAEDGTTSTVQLDKKTGAAGEFTTFTGSAVLTFTEADTVYLRMTHHTGNHRYDNISLVLGEYEKPTVTENPNEKETQLFGTDIYKEGSFTIYDDSNTAGEITVWDNYGIQASMGNDWNSNNGVKTNITEYVKGYSGSEFTLSAAITTWAWNGDNDTINKAKAFFKVVSENGDERIVSICEGPDSADDIADNEAVIAGRAALEFEDTDTVYLCFTQGGGQHQYKAISFSVIESSEEPSDPTKTPSNPTEDPNIEKTVIFEPSGLEGYSEFEVHDPANGTVTPNDGYVNFQQNEGYSWNTENGVKINVTEYLKKAKSGDTFEASFVFRSYYWGGTNINAYFETADGRTAGLKTTTEVGTDGEDQNVVVKGAFAYSEDDVVYLHILHPSGTHTYSYFKLSAMETAAEPTMEPGIGGIEVYTPELTDTGAVTVISNKSNDNANITIYTAKYTDDALSGVKLTNAEIPANTLNNEVAFEAEEGDTVYIWNDKQQALIDKYVMRQTAMVGTWSAAQQEFFESNINDVTGNLSNTTIRQRVHLSTGGDKLTVELSNQFGAGALEITAAHAAIPEDGSAIKPETDTPITFDGVGSVIIPAGMTVVSDPVYISTEDLSDLFITISVGDVPYRSVISTYSTGLTGHSNSRSTSYVKSGVPVSTQDMSSASKVSSWLFLAGINVLAPAENEAIVCFGDSITDGVGSTDNGNNRWPDVLAGLCKENEATGNISVLNMGIGGNAVVSGSVGPMASVRFEKDVLSQAGVKYVVLLEGINDIGKESAVGAEPSYSEQIIDVYKGFIEKAHENDIKIYCGTILPCGNYTSYYSDYEEQLRGEINTWIKSDGSGFDGVIDFAEAMEDPEKPGYLNTLYDCGDGLHPNVAGYELMGTMVYNAVFD